MSHLWLKLGALQRATGQPEVALARGPSRADLAPLDFTALLMRASLLDAMERAEAAEAWGHALAQRPDGELPPHLPPPWRAGEERRAAVDWPNARRQMLGAMAPSEARADAEQQRRMARFRDNVLRRTRPYHSEPTHFPFPELVEREFHPRRLFPWLAAVEAATERITREMQAVMAAERAELVPYIQYADHLPLDQWRAAEQQSLTGRRSICSRMASGSMPTRVIARRRWRCWQRSISREIAGAWPNAMFSLLAPDTPIPPHVGVNNTRLVCHLPLIVPEGCWFRVGARNAFLDAGRGVRVRRHDRA